MTTLEKLQKDLRDNPFIPLEEGIECECNDRSCEKLGVEGEVNNHISDCSCGDCHRAMGKISIYKTFNI